LARVVRKWWEFLFWRVEDGRSWVVARLVEYTAICAQHWCPADRVYGQEVRVGEDVPGQIRRTVGRVLLTLFVHLGKGKQAVQLRLQVLGFCGRQVDAA
jgi:hypothetical protein